MLTLKTSWSYPVITYIRQLGEPHDSHLEAMDTLAGALSIENIHFGFVDSSLRAVLFADCGDFTRGLSKDQSLVSGVLGKGFNRREPTTDIVMVEVQDYSEVQRMTTMDLMSQRSPWLLFAHVHPTKPGLVVLYLDPKHEISGLTQTPGSFDL